MTTPAPKKLYIKTWGCQMNEYDSRRMADVLAPLGYKPVEEADDADMVILNTCHIREKATDKVFSDLGRIRDNKMEKAARGEKMIVAVAGCVAQAEGEFIAKRAPYVDMVFGPQTYHLLPEMVVKATGQRVINTEFATENKFDTLPAESGNTGPAAHLSIQEGCDKFCTFCVVPYTRGAEFSRPLAAIIEEAKRMAGGGTKDITLLGQNVNAWHGENGETLGDLLYALHDIDGIAQLRYMTSHPRDMHDRLYDAHRDLPKVMPYVHLPIQSGSDAILKAMNRKHTAADYMEIITRLKKGRPDIAFSSDFIVGFPGESDSHFEETMALVGQVEFASSFSFKYSARPGTPAASMQGLVRDEVASERLARLQELLRKQAQDFNSACVGKTMDVVFSGTGSKDGQLYARTPYNQAIHVEAPARLFGQLARVEVTGAHANALTGRVATAETVLAA
ncbi:MAG: tRNA (N6-isopentenyl adenosine(37)-C2)-methylthiotransferase MiaB [Alphaproteobacteria bacterium]|nr:tRNA (N6-isopentenyl adenosine(37)-C2)-methylthiotransferase MiaB [Alphaproteobacteria bacterium]